MLNVVNIKFETDEDQFNLVDEPTVIEDLVQAIPKLVIMPEPIVMQVE